MTWPVEEGRYKTGDPKNPVALCTLACVDIEVPEDSVAIQGKCVTENIGMEKIIKNILANPNIRFLVTCGDEPKGHWVGQAFQCIKKDGVDDDMRIIGAKGAMPYLRNITKEEVETFRKQVEPIDIIGENDVEKISAKISELVSLNPGSFEGHRPEASQETETIECEFIEDWKPDPNGWFTITLDRQNNMILVEHYMGYGPDAKLHAKLSGKSAKEICSTIARFCLASNLYHACYLGMELMKAEHALSSGKEYEQDSNN